MLSEVMEFYGLERDFQAAGFFETEQHRQLMKAIRPTLLSGKLAAITGPVGSGKTLFLRRFEAILEQEGRLTVARSLSVDEVSPKPPSRRRRHPLRRFPLHRNRCRQLPPNR